MKTFKIEGFWLLYTENLHLHGEDGKEGEKSFFAECKHKHSPQSNELCGIEER
jgi:hypothetical protein